MTEQRSAFVAFETSLLIIYGIRECYTSLLLKYPVIGSDPLDCMNIVSSMSCFQQSIIDCFRTVVHGECHAVVGGLWLVIFLMVFVFTMMNIFISIVRAVVSPL